MLDRDYISHRNGFRDACLLITIELDRLGSLNLSQHQFQNILRTHIERLNKGKIEIINIEDFKASKNEK